jgi:iron(III) transport system ATP-binding protein
MENGRIVQQGDPRSIYSKPATRFVAEFIGSANFVPGTIVRAGADALVDIEGGSLRCAIPNGLAAGAKVLVSIRPEDIVLRAVTEQSAGQGANRILGRVVEQIFLGSLADHLVAAGGAEFRAWCHPAASFAPGSEVVIEVDPARCIVLPGKA